MSHSRFFRLAKVSSFKVYIYHSIEPRPPQQTSSGHGPASHGHMSYQSKYGELLNVIEDLGREIKPTYAGSKMAQERLKKGKILFY